MIDPYNRMGNNRIGLFHSLDRDIKNQIIFFNHDAILIGSSKTGRINPDELHFFTFYNASFDAATPEEIYFYLEKYAVHEKFILVGLDFFMFNEREFPLKIMSEWHNKSYSTIEYLLGGKVLRDSKKAVSLWLKNEKPYSIMKNGQKVLPKSSNPPDPQGIERAIDFLKRHHYGNVRFSDKRMEFIEKTKKLLEDRNIDYLIFVNPFHEEIYEAFKRMDSYKLFVDWKQKLKVIFPDLVDLAYSQYSAKDGFMPGDSFHYKPETGVAFLNNILRNARKGSSG
ncbi:hypothetical protein ACFL03_00860 [Thermodesulfobacteriota bacterium]